MLNSAKNQGFSTRLVTNEPEVVYWNNYLSGNYKKIYNDRVNYTKDIKTEDGNAQAQYHSFCLAENKQFNSVVCGKTQVIDKHWTY